MNPCVVCGAPMSPGGFCKHATQAMLNDRAKRFALVLQYLREQPLAVELVSILAEDEWSAESLAHLQNVIRRRVAQ